MIIPGSAATFKLVSTDTDGSHSVIETTVPAGFAGPPPHVHRSMDEEFYVVYGELTVRVDEWTVTAARGTYTYVPHGTIHTFSNRSDRPAAFLDIVHPAGFERYYRDLAAFREVGEMPSRETFAALFAKYDIKVVPLSG